MFHFVRKLENELPFSTTGTVAACVIISLLPSTTFGNGNCSEKFQCRYDLESEIIRGGKPSEKLINSTFCMYQDECRRDCQASCRILRPLFIGQEKVWLGMHNKLRNTVAEGKHGKWPKASNMNQLVWHSELADGAIRWLKQCKRGRDKCRKSPSFLSNPNQLVGFLEDPQDYPNFTDVFVKWKEEYKKVPADSGEIQKIVRKWPKDRDKPIKNFGQLIWATTRYVGCGMIQFRNLSSDHFETHVACNYHPPGWGLDTSPDLHETSGQLYEVRVKKDCGCKTSMKCYDESTYPNLCASPDDPKDEVPVTPVQQPKRLPAFSTVAPSVFAIIIIVISFLFLFGLCCVEKRNT